MTEPAPAAAPPGRSVTQSALVESFGGKRGLLDSGLPAVVFVFVYSVVAAFASRDTALNSALAGAVVVGAGVVLLRLVRKETLQQAISGFLGLAVAVWFARRSGEARGFFLPGILINLGYGLLFLGSSVIGRPVVGYVYAAIEGLQGWREDRRLRRIFAVASAGWAMVFAARAVVQGTLYVMDRPGLLAAARLLMGWPLTIGAVALTIAYVRRARTQDADPTAGPPPA